jgi:hypothetical protein
MPRPAEMGNGLRRFACCSSGVGLGLPSVWAAIAAEAPSCQSGWRQGHGSCAVDGHRDRRGGVAVRLPQRLPRLGQLDLDHRGHPGAATPAGGAVGGLLQLHRLRLLRHQGGQHRRADRQARLRQRGRDLRGPAGGDSLELPHLVATAVGGAGRAHRDRPGHDLGGWRIAHTMGQRITELRPARGWPPRPAPLSPCSARPRWGRRCRPPIRWPGWSPSRRLPWPPPGVRPHPAGQPPAGRGHPCPPGSGPGCRLVDRAAADRAQPAL